MQTALHTGRGRVEPDLTTSASKLARGRKASWAARHVARGELSHCPIGPKKSRLGSLRLVSIFDVLNSKSLEVVDMVEVAEKRQVRDAGVRCTLGHYAITAPLRCGRHICFDSTPARGGSSLFCQAGTTHTFSFPFHDAETPRLAILAASLWSCNVHPARRVLPAQYPIGTFFEHLLKRKSRLEATLSSCRRPRWACLGGPAMCQ